jgi:hypothetical protein
LGHFDGLRISATLERSFRGLVVFSFIITGLAFTCAAVCLSSLTVLSITLKVGGRHDAESRLASAQLPPRIDFRKGTTAGLANVGERQQQGVQFVSFESRFSSALPLLLRDLRDSSTAGLASVSNGLQQGIQLIRFDAPTLASDGIHAVLLEIPERLQVGAAVTRGRPDRVERYAPVRA